MSWIPHATKDARAQEDLSPVLLSSPSQLIVLHHRRRRCRRHLLSRIAKEQTYTMNTWTSERKSDDDFTRFSVWFFSEYIYILRVL